MALALLHRSCPLSGEVVETGGGWASVLRWERSAGIRFADTDGITGRWDDLTRFDEHADHPSSTADGLAPAVGDPR